ncbi:MAG: diguanylate phosphodiesterase [Myxococcota bacterium]
MGDAEIADDRAEGEELLELFARGTELTLQLLDETARLRRRLAEVSSAADASIGGAGDPGERGAEQSALRDWIAKIDELSAENRELLEELRAAEARNQSWAARHAEIEERHNDLANLYVASYQLHASFDPREVIAAISEIVINLIGAEVFALYACDEASGRLTPVACEGRPLDWFPVLSVGTGLIGSVVADGTTFVASQPAGGEVPKDGEPVAVIPLYARGHALGAIALYKLFDQKAGLSELDRQLFGLLESHAATALLSARWMPESPALAIASPGRSDRLSN